MCKCSDITIPFGSKGDKGDTGATGATGPAGATGSMGATGSTGAAGADGTDAYVYIAYADDDLGTGFTTTFDPDKDYIAIFSSSTYIALPDLADSDFTGLWKMYKGQTGATGAVGATGPTGPQGIQGIQGIAGADGADATDGAELTYGTADPVTPGTTNPALYINTDTYDIWLYTSSWSKIIQGYQAWQSIGAAYNTSDGWQDSGDTNFILEYRKEGKNVRIIGKPSNATPTGLAVAQTIFTLPAGYRPEFTVYETGLDLTLAATPIIEIQPGGAVRARGDLATFTIDSCYFNITFPLA